MKEEVEKKEKKKKKKEKKEKEKQEKKKRIGCVKNQGSIRSSDLCHHPISITY